MNLVLQQQFITISKNRIEVRTSADLIMVIRSACLLIQRRSSQFLSLFKCGAVIKIWRRCPISFKHASLCCLFLDPHRTTTLHTSGNLHAICPKYQSDPVELSSIFGFVDESPSLSKGWNHGQFMAKCFCALDFFKFSAPKCRCRCKDDSHSSRIPIPSIYARRIHFSNNGHSALALQILQPWFHAFIIEMNISYWFRQLSFDFKRFKKLMIVETLFT